jgi:CHAT domain-containing protein
MQTFYDNWLSGMEKHDAFVKAQQTIKKAYSNPYFWAGFVMLD